MVWLTRPKNPVLVKIFFSIQEDMEPHKINISWLFLLNSRSQAFLNFPKNVGSCIPIQEISSNNRITSPCWHSFANTVNKSAQSSPFNPGNEKYPPNREAN